MMNPLSRLPALAARVAHEVITEYRRLDAPPAEPGPVQQELSCTQARTESAWMPPMRAPVSARLGFSLPDERDG